MIPSIPIGRRLAIAGFALLTSVAVRAAESPAVPAGWFAWPAVEPADGSAFDVSALNAARGADLPRIRVDDGRFVTPDGQRIRFWGANVAGADAYPPTEADAVALARHLAKGGVNIVRLHHLDNPWGVGKGGSIWPAGKLHRELDPTQLDRLHRFIAALRDQGIYSNLNLKVSKQLSPEDGFDASVADIPNFDKRVDIFDRRMVELQKDYARRLLTTKNPYTGLAPAEDPAVAVVEINNENSLLGYWTRDLGRNLEKFPAPFVEELRGQWNTWLAHCYAGDEALAAAWTPATPAAGATGSLIPASARWSAKTQPDSAATIDSATPSALEIHVTRADASVDWHVQVALHGLAIEDGAVYTVQFLAKADHPRALGVGVGVDGDARPQDDWRSFGLLQSVDVGTDWTPVRLVFPAHSVAGAPAALSLNAGQATGTIAIKEVELVRDCAGAGLQPGQSATAGTVPLPLAPSARQWADWIHFLADTERAYAEEMRDYLKNDLHVQAAIICSQIDYGGLTGLNRETSMDFADGHAYWQHPDFPAGASWDQARWTIRNTPQLDAFAARTFGELGSLALVRVAGKPYTVSEYDHPAPSEFACEMYPEVASFAARQDWDIIYPFCIGADGAANPEGRIVDFFDQLHHPAKWAQSPFASLVLREGLVPPAARGRTLHLGSPVWAEQPHADVLWHELISDGALDFLDVRYAVSDRPGEPGAKATLATAGTDAAAPAPVRIASAAQGRVYLIDTPQAAAAVGFLGGATVDAGALRVACERFGRDFASVTAVALDRAALRESKRILVTVVARATNQGIVWNEAHNSVGAQWGHGPTIAEHVPATITLAGAATRVVYALAPDGTRAHRVTTTAADGGLTFVVAPGDHTLGYEIVLR